MSKKTAITPTESLISPIYRHLHKEEQAKFMKGFCPKLLSLFCTDIFLSMGIISFFKTAPEVQSDKFRSLVKKGYISAIRDAIDKEKSGGEDSVSIDQQNFRVVRVREASKCRNRN